MDPLTWGVLAKLLLEEGPTAVALAIKIWSNIDAGKTAIAVTQADRDELAALCALTSDAIYKREGVTPPPRPS